MTKLTGLVALKTQNSLAVVESESRSRLSAKSKNTFIFNTKRPDYKALFILYVKFKFKK